MCQDRATTNMAYLVFTQPCMHSEHGSLYGVRGIRFLASSQSFRSFFNKSKLRKTFFNDNKHLFQCQMYLGTSYLGTPAILINIIAH